MAEEFRTPAGDPAEFGVAFGARHGAESGRTRVPENGAGQAAVRATDRLAAPPNRPRRAAQFAGQRAAVRHARHPIRRHAARDQKEERTRQKSSNNFSDQFYFYILLSVLACDQ